MTSIGSIGERVDIDLRAGDTLGPFSLTFTDEAGTAIDLTGSTLTASMSKQDDTGADIVMTATVTNAALGQATLTLAYADTSALASNDFFNKAASYAWRLVLTDSQGTKWTLMYGTVNVASGMLP